MNYIFNFCLIATNFVHKQIYFSQCLSSYGWLKFFLGCLTGGLAYPSVWFKVPGRAILYCGFQTPIVRISGGAAPKTGLRFKQSS